MRTRSAIQTFMVKAAGSQYKSVVDPAPLATNITDLPRLVQAVTNVHCPSRAEWKTAVQLRVGRAVDDTGNAVPVTDRELAVGNVVEALQVAWHSHLRGGGQVLKAALSMLAGNNPPRVCPEPKPAEWPMEHGEDCFVAARYVLDHGILTVAEAVSNPPSTLGDMLAQRIMRRMDLPCPGNWNVAAFRGECPQAPLVRYTAASHLASFLQQQPSS